MMDQVSGAFPVMSLSYVISFLSQALGVLNPSVPVKIIFLHLLTEKVINIVEMIAKLS